MFLRSFFCPTLSGLISKGFFLGYISQSKSGMVFGRLNAKSVMGKCRFIRGKPGNTRNEPLFEPETNPENQWLKDEISFWGAKGLFSGVSWLLVSGWVWVFQIGFGICLQLTWHLNLTPGRWVSLFLGPGFLAATYVTFGVEVRRTPNRACWSS